MPYTFLTVWRSGMNRKITAYGFTQLVCPILPGKILAVNPVRKLVKLRSAAIKNDLDTALGSITPKVSRLTNLV